MKNTINQRIKEIVNQLFDGNKASFAKQVNVRPTTLYNCLKKENPSMPSGEILEKIVAKIEDLSAEWLLTGKGEMLKTGDISITDSPQTMANTGTQGDNCNQINGLSEKTVAKYSENYQDIIKKMQVQIDKKDEQIDVFVNRLNEKDKQIDHLINQLTQKDKQIDKLIEKLTIFAN